MLNYEIYRKKIQKHQQSVSNQGYKVPSLVYFEFKLFEALLWGITAFAMNSELYLKLFWVYFKRDAHRDEKRKEESLALAHSLAANSQSRVLLSA